MLYDEANDCQLCPRLTGIPPHIVQLNQIDTLKAIILRTSDRYGELLVSELNRRSVGGEVFQANTILDDMRAMRQEIRNDIQRALNVPGGSAINQEENGDGGRLGSAANGDQIVIPSSRTRPEMYVWGGRLHNVPQNFVLPTMNLQTLITYWFCGSQHPVVPALKNVKSWDFPNPKTMKVRLCQMKQLITHVLRGYEYNGHNIGAAGIDTPAKATRLYEATRELFTYPGTHNNRRHSAFTWKTVFNDLQRHRFKFVGEE